MDEYIRYSGCEIPNVDYHHGQLRPVVGAQRCQVLRANREHPELAEGLGWTYNHAPNIVHWNGCFYCHYLSNPISEHTGPGQTLLATSPDGMHWDNPRVLFPPYRLNLALDNGPRQELLGEGACACMHQRMGFYIAPDGRLLALGYYGISPEVFVMPCKGYGVGRVVREVYSDGAFGPIYFILYNTTCGYNEHNCDYPHYRSSPDAGFVRACDALLADKLAVQQWWEENRDNPDPDFFAIREAGEAFNHYTLADGTVVGLWKHAKVSLSHDGGKSWDPVKKSWSLVMSGGKVWGERTSDWRYALVYNPVTDSTHRWPLAVVTSDNGIDFREMLCAVGEVPLRRYQGTWKDFGPQYVRGLEAGSESPDGSMILTYSVNKEDIWVARLPVPIRGVVDKHVDDDFADMEPGGPIRDWNITSPLWAPVALARGLRPGGNEGTVLRLRCFDLYDYAVAERVFPESVRVCIRTAVRPHQNAGQLQLDIVDRRSCCVFRVTFDAGHTIRLKHGNAFTNLPYAAGEWVELALDVDCHTKTVDVTVNGCEFRGLRFFGNAATVERAVFRTGAPRREPAIDDDTDPPDRPGAGEPLQQEVVYDIGYFKTR